MRYPVRRR